MVEVEFLRDLHEWGARRALPETFVGVDAERLLKRGYVQLQRTRVGEVIVLGARGREVLGLDKKHLTPPYTSCRHILVREARKQLEDEGYIYEGRKGKSLRIFKRAGKTVYLTGSYPNIRARSVRHILQYHRGTLIREQSKLVVATTRPSTMRGIERRASAHLQVLKVEMRIIP